MRYGTQALWLMIALFGFATPAGSQVLPSLSKSLTEVTASALSDGRFYVFGRDCATPQIYDPRGQSLVLPLPANQSLHQCVGVAQDRLLSCGADRCEIFDPNTFVWTTLATYESSAGPQGLPISLPGGDILFAGVPGIFGQNLAWRLNPPLYEARRTTNMAVFQSEPSMVRLADGRILAIGGYLLPVLGHYILPVTQAQMFDPSAQTWLETSPPLQSLGGSGPQFSAYNLGGIMALALADNTVICNSSWGPSFNPSAIPNRYDPLHDVWSLVSGFHWPWGAPAFQFPSGDVLIPGGLDAQNTPQSSSVLWNPGTGASRPARPLSVARARYALEPTADGTLLALGGQGQAGTLDSVEVVSFGQPSAALPLKPGFYVAAAEPYGAGDDGFWGINVSLPVTSVVVPTGFEGALFFGGLLAASGGEVAFLEFHLSTSQQVTIGASLRPYDQASPLSQVLRILDGGKNELARAEGGDSTSWSGGLLPGYYVVEVRSGAGSGASALSGSVVGRFDGGAAAGGSLVADGGVPGYLAFALGVPQTVNVRLLNEQTYGIPRGAQRTVLTIYDGTGNVLSRVPAGIGIGR